MLPGLLGKRRPLETLFGAVLSGKTCQNLRVSSPAPVTIVLPSGDIAK